MKINELIVNGISTGDFEFPIFVERNDGFKSPKKKNVLYESDQSTGASKRSVNAWPPIQKTYELYCLTDNLADLRPLKLWAADEGELTPSDEPDVFYEILDVEMSPAVLEDVTGYRITVVFTVQPFGYEMTQPVRTYRNGDVIENKTNAPMYPNVKVYGNTNSEARIEIADQVMFLERIHTMVEIECKPQHQNVFRNTGSLFNSNMRGDFIHIPANSSHRIILSENIDRIILTERWGWL